jgi:tetratricopeptide (TPR) repeat protein
MPMPLLFEFFCHFLDFFTFHGNLRKYPYCLRNISMSKKIGRNDPCYCGSGKKYKKCCLTKDTVAKRQHPSSAQSLLDNLMESIAFADDDNLDELSNSIVDLINEGKLDEAESACNELERCFPEMIDCLDRRAMLLEARGDNKLAAEYFRRAADHARNHDGFDEEAIDDYIASAERLDPISRSENS